MSNFNGDLKIGELGVEIVRKIFKNRGFLVRKGPEGNFPGYDLQVKRPDNPAIKDIEVKFDLSSAITGNIAIEHKALSKSKASHYVYLVVKAYSIPKEKLEWLTNSPDFKQVPGGDFGDLVSLVPVEELELSHFKRL